MNQYPFGVNGRFWRGNLHTHSTLSDGTNSPEDVCRLYREAGYDFISLTEHFLESYGFPIADTVQYRTEAFTTLIGAELHGPQIEMGSPWHIVAVGLPLDFAQPQAETGPDLAARAMAAGAHVTVAHPQWYTLTDADIATLGDFHAIEVFNGVAIDHNDRSDSWHIADTVLSKGRRVNVTASDDNHSFEGRWDFQRGWVWVKSNDLTPESILAALKEGHYYSSTGPQIVDVRVVAGKSVAIECSPAERIFVTGRGPAVVSQGGRGITSVELDISEFSSPYGRITVRDAKGGRAWTNPFWFDEM